MKIIDEDLNILEIEDIIKKFDFIITSRYHSIVHSYKNGVPALVIGWSIKYFELLKIFHQSQYCINYDNIKYEENIIQSLGIMIKNSKNEKRKINIILNELLNQATIFGILNENK